MKRADLPKGWHYEEAELESAFHLHAVYGNDLLVSNIYSQMNYLQFLGKSYSHWALPDDLGGALSQNYLILCASVLEAILTLAFGEKAAMCRQNCQNKPLKNCTFFYRNSVVEPEKKVPVDKMAFAEMLKAAEVDGFLNGIEPAKLTELRRLRNGVHLSTKKDRFSKTGLAAKEVNEYLQTMRKLIQNAAAKSKEWKGKCLKGSIR